MSKPPTQATQTVAAVPADGWKALYRTDKGKNIFAVPLACFAICVVDGQSGLVPMVCEMDGRIIPAPSKLDFDCIVEPGVADFYVREEDRVVVVVRNKLEVRPNEATQIEGSNG